MYAVLLLFFVELVQRIELMKNSCLFFLKSRQFCVGVKS